MDNIWRQTAPAAQCGAAAPLTIRREELMNDCRTDEVFVIIRGARPLRCGRAIYFRRPELAERVAANRFNANSAAAAAAAAAD